MRPPNSRQFQFVLLLLTLLSALIMGYLVVWLASGGSSAELPGRRAVLGASDESVTETTLADAPVLPSPTSRPPGPTPTFVPITPSVPLETPSVAEEPAPEPSPEPPTEPIFPTNAPPTQPLPTPEPAPPAPEPDPIVVNSPAVRLEDTAWQGGYRQGRGYGGRSATWIYGRATSYTTMQTVIVLDTPPRGTATLSIEGMDSEDRAKTPIRITVNGREIFNGPNPLPNDDLPLATGTWAMHDFRFDAAALQPGRNVIRISNLAPGQFSLPPFFMLDYAVLSLPGAAPPREAAPPPATVEPSSTPPPPTETPTELPTSAELPTEAPPSEAPTELPTEAPASPAP
jgi:outer membrane biosynthesis protein TonB